MVTIITKLCILCQKLIKSNNYVIPQRWVATRIERACLKICYRQADHIISAYDKNKDGKITVDELTAVFGEEKGKKNFE